jgi:hypothetical protein
MLSGALGIVSLAHVEDGRRVYMSFFKTDSVLMSNSLRAQKNRPSVFCVIGFFQFRWQA